MSGHFNIFTNLTTSKQNICDRKSVSGCLSTMPACSYSLLVCVLSTIVFHPGKEISGQTETEMNREKQMNRQ